jgi:hypothetical protein
LLGHRPANFRDAVANVDDRGLARRIKKFASVRGKKPAAFSTDGDRHRLVKIARKKSGVVGHAGSLSDCSRLVRPIT